MLIATHGKMDEIQMGELNVTMNSRYAFVEQSNDATMEGDDGGRSLRSHGDS